MNTDKLISISFIIIAAAAVGVADILIKKATVSSPNLLVALKSPLILTAIALYISQIALFAYIFIKKWEIAIAGPLEMVTYSIIVIVYGLLFFNEKITTLQSTGIFFALLGALLMNL